MLSPIAGELLENLFPLVSCSSLVIDEPEAHPKDLGSMLSKTVVKIEDSVESGVIHLCTQVQHVS